jgi:hypothetical protein
MTTPANPAFSVAISQVVLAVLCGVATAYQPGINARFAEHAGSKIHGGVVCVRWL